MLFNFEIEEQISIHRSGGIGQRHGFAKYVFDVYVFVIDQLYTIIKDDKQLIFNNNKVKFASIS